MGVKDLMFSIFAQDKTASGFGSVNRRMRETEGVAASLNERIGRSGKAMQRFGLMGSIASAGVASLFRGNLEAYDEQSRAEAKVAQAIKATGGTAGFTADQLEDQAAALQKLTRIGDEDILNNVTAQFLTFKRIGGDIFTDAQTAALDLSTVLDGDLQAASIMLGKALDDPARGLSAMSRAGVTFTDEQKKVIKALQETGDIAGAQRVILDEIASAYGGQAEAARKSGTGMVDAWRNTWGDIKEEVGGVLVQLLPPVIDGLGRVADMFKGLSPEAKRFAVIAGAIGLALPPIVGSLGLLAVGLGALSGPIGLAVAAVAGLTAGIAYFWPEIKASYEWLNDNLAPALADLGAAFESVKPYITALIDGGIVLFNIAVEGLMVTLGLFRDGAQTAFQIVSGAADLLVAGVEAVASTYTNVLQGVLGLFGTDLAAVGKSVLALKDQVVASFTAIPGYVLDTVTKVKEYLGATFTAIFDKVGEKVEWVERKFFWLYDKVVGNSWVPDLVDEIGQSFALLDGNMVKPTNDATSAVNSDFKGLGGEVGSKLSSLASDGKLTWKSFWGSLLDVGSSYADKIINQVFGDLSKGIASSLSSTFSGFGGGSGGGLFGGFFGNLFGGGSSGGLFGGLPGFSTGGSGLVTGKAGVDRNTVAMNLSAGENFQVTKRGEPQGGQSVTVNIYTRDVESFQASRAQVGGQIGRAVAAGNRAR